MSMPSSCSSGCASESQVRRSVSATLNVGGANIDEVRVLSQEAVGMYQVAVLEAGSPKALEAGAASTTQMADAIIAAL